MLLSNVYVVQQQQQEPNGSTARLPAHKRCVALNPYLLRILGQMRLRARRLRPALTIVYATVTGTTRGYAQRLAKMLSSACAVEIMSAEDYAPASLARTTVVVQMTSTYGSGAPPTSARKWLAYLSSAEAKQVRSAALGAQNGATCPVFQTHYARSHG